MDFTGKKVVIMGLGINKEGSGVSSALFFARAGAQVLVTDYKPRSFFTAQIKKLTPHKNIRFVFGRHNESDFKNADIIIKNPDVPKSSPYLAVARTHGIPVHNDWSVFLSLHDNPLVGVTGTRGKSTTTTLIHEMLRNTYSVKLCGNIGVSPLAIAGKTRPEDVLVAELSSWNLQQFDVVKKSPHIAVVTNLLPDHLNKYKNIREYYRDKENIFRYQTNRDALVANRDNKEVVKRVKKAKAHILWFSHKPFKGDGAYVKNGKIMFSFDGRTEQVCSVKEIRIPGAHNLENVLAAVCVAAIAGISPKEIKRTITRFRGIPNRLELVRETKGVQYYNDTTATSPDAVIAALRALDSKKVVLLAGGTDKKLDYSLFAKEIRKYKPRLILFAGTATDKIRKELKKYPRILGEVRSMKEAMRLAKAHAKKGDIVLLSPGAASFGIFKNEFDRGAQFYRQVKTMHS